MNLFGFVAIMFLATGQPWFAVAFAYLAFITDAD